MRIAPLVFEIEIICDTFLSLAPHIKHVQSECIRFPMTLWPSQTNANTFLLLSFSRSASALAQRERTKRSAKQNVASKLKILIKVLLQIRPERATMKWFHCSIEWEKTRRTNEKRVAEKRREWKSEEDTQMTEETETEAEWPRTF